MAKVTLISENSSRFDGVDRMGIGVRVWKSWIWPGIKTVSYTHLTLPTN